MSEPAGYVVGWDTGPDGDTVVYARVLTNGEIYVDDVVYAAPVPQATRGVDGVWSVKTP